MSKKKVKAPADEQPEMQVSDLETLQAQHDALADEVLTLRELVDALKDENGQLRAEIAQLRETTAQAANSAGIAPPPPAPPVRPVVEIGGEQYRFKVGETRLGRKVVAATVIAADETLLSEVFGKYPGLFEKM